MSLCDTCWYADKGWEYCPIYHPDNKVEQCPAYCPDDGAMVEEEMRQEDS